MSPKKSSGSIGDETRCAFCGKTPAEANAMIQGPNGVYLCDECIAICTEALIRDLGMNMASPMDDRNWDPVPQSSRKAGKGAAIDSDVPPTPTGPMRLEGKSLWSVDANLVVPMSTSAPRAFVQYHLSGRRTSADMRTLPPVMSWPSVCDTQTNICPAVIWSTCPKFGSLESTTRATPVPSSLMRRQPSTPAHRL